MESLNNENSKKSRLINNRYRIHQKIGEGGMGEVYIVTDLLNTQNQIALKTIKEKLVNEASLISFKNEFEIMTRLKHHDLLRVYDFGHDINSGQYYITMDLLQGKPLSHYIESNPEYLQHHIFSMLVNCCRTLSFIHTRNIIHRDINPRNIIIHQESIEDSPSLTIMDFGLSDLLVKQGRDKQTKTKGTLNYMAPEVLMNVVGAQTDIYALGITFLEVVTGTNFLDQMSTNEVVQLLFHQKELNTLMNKHIRSVSDEKLRNILDKMTTYDTKKRYRSCTDIIHDINTISDTMYEYETDLTKTAYVLGAGFVGRKEELSILKDHITHDNNPNKAVWVKGEAGVGKSRLFFEFKKYCQLNTIPFYEGTCRPYLYLSPFIPILDELILHATEDDISHYGPILKRILHNHIRLKDLSIPRALDPVTDQYLLIDAITNFLIDAANHTDSPLVIYLNDMHISDETSVKAVNMLTRKLKSADKLKFFMTSRLQGIDNLSEALKDNDHLVLKLNGFNEKLVNAYLNAIFGSRQGPLLKKSTGCLTKRIGGNPFFLQEMIKTLVETNNITFDNAYWELKGNLSEVDIPIHLEELIINNLNRLDLTEHQQKVIEILALINREISYNELTSIIHVDFHFITYLKDQEIIKSDMGESHIVYKPAHDLIVDTITDKIRDKASKHNFIALALEKLNKDNPEEYTAEIASHFYRADNKEKAVLYLNKAIDLAIAQFDNKNILDLSDKLLSILDQKKDAPMIIDTTLKKCDVLEWYGQNNLGIELAHTCYEKAKTIGDKRRQANSLILLHFHINDSDSDKYDDKKILEEAFELFRSLDDKEGMSKIYRSLGYYYNQTDYIKALDYFNKGIELAKEVYHEETLGGLYCNSSYVYIRMGNFQKAIDYAEKGLVYFDRLNHKRNQTIAYFSLATSYKFMGHPLKALKYTSEALIISEVIHFVSMSFDLHLLKGELLLSLNRLDEAKFEYYKMKRYLPETNFSGDIASFMLLDVLIKKAEQKYHEAEQILCDIISKYGNEVIPDKELFYETWKLTHSEKYRKKALTFINEQIKKAPSFYYKMMLEELENKEE